jgi:hypothetical protein
MSDIIVSPVPSAGLDARQGMFRVWLVISAVWVAFWLAIAAIVLFTVEMRAPLADELGLYSIIVLAPPLGLLGIGVLCRWIFETVRAVRHPHHPPRHRTPKVAVDRNADC